MHNFDTYMHIYIYIYMYICLRLKGPPSGRSDEFSHPQEGGHRGCAHWQSSSRALMFRAMAGPL